MFTFGSPDGPQVKYSLLYPQVVDIFVDKYSNCLQKCILSSVALAQWRGVRNNSGGDDVRQTDRATRGGC
jgi:hypothetical protein